MAEAKALDSQEVAKLDGNRGARGWRDSTAPCTKPIWAFHMSPSTPQALSELTPVLRARNSSEHHCVLLQNQRNKKKRNRYLVPKPTGFPPPRGPSHVPQRPLPSVKVPALLPLWDQALSAGFGLASFLPGTLPPGSQLSPCNARPSARPSNPLLWDLDRSELEKAS